MVQVQIYCVRWPDRKRYELDDRLAVVRGQVTKIAGLSVAPSVDELLVGKDNARMVEVGRSSGEVGYP
jgi:hypothetical protein